MKNNEMILENKYTLKEIYENAIREFKDKPMMGFVGQKLISYSEFGDSVKCVSKFLKKQGIGKGDKVSIISENKPNWGISFFAITTIGAVAIPILTEFRNNEIKHILKHSEAKVIFVSEKQYAKLEDMHIEEKYTIILIDDFSVIPPQTTKETLKKMIKNKSNKLSNLKEKAYNFVGFKTKINPEDLATIIYTSGTTGHSKGVMLTHKNLVFDAYMSREIQNININDISLSVLPLAHTYELTLNLILIVIAGASVYYLEKPPIPRILLSALKKVRPTIMLVVPLLIEKIFKKIQRKFHKNVLIRSLYSIRPIKKMLHKIAGKKLTKSFGGRIRFFGIGGALLAPETERFLLDAKIPYAIGYGLSETSPVVAGAVPTKVKFRSAGFSIPNVKIRIANPNPITNEGEIQIYGQNVMKGYYKDPEKTKEVMTEDGWFRSGDLGLIINERLYIKGRIKNMIVGASGKNIYPEQLESLINNYDYVNESIIYSDNSQIVARINFDYDQIDEMFSESSFTESQIMEQIKKLLNKIQKEVNQQVATFSSINRCIEQIEPFEKTPTKKIKRYLYTK
ncbi:MAG: AMP-binding protein [Candidatus Cloacimonadota bacterium]|nr:AMP-binding protein [Candidatus Cloacimonadota bacterium]